MPKKTFEIAEKAKAIYITQVKGNQGSLLKQIRHGANIGKPESVYHEDIDKAHGRVEARSYEVFDARPVLKKWPDWPHIRSIIRVTRKRDVYIRKEGRYKCSTEISYYVCNRQMSARKSGRHIRQHWFIENKLHHVKDATFREDFNRKEERPENFSVCIDIALNIIKNPRRKQRGIQKSLNCRSSCNFLYLLPWFLT